MLIGVEPIRRVLPIAPLTYYAFKAKQRDPALLSAKAIRDAELRVDIERIREENYRAYKARKIWKALNRQKIAVARCTVERVMREMGLRGVVRGKTAETYLLGHPV